MLVEVNGRHFPEPFRASAKKFEPLADERVRSFSKSARVRSFGRRRVRTFDFILRFLKNRRVFQHFSPKRFFGFAKGSEFILSRKKHGKGSGKIRDDQRVRGKKK